MIRNASRKAYEVLRQFIPLPTVDNLDRKFKRKIDEFEERLQNKEKVPELLQKYKSQQIKKSGVIFMEKNGKKIIPCVLATDAMAIEPYMEKTENASMSYYFVYYLMPLDHSLPCLVLSVVPRPNGKANEELNSHMDYLKQQCETQDFSVVALSADGDNAYNAFMKGFYKALDKGLTKQSFEEIVGMVRDLNYPFVTDFFHFMKCLRNRIASHALSIRSDFPVVFANELADILGAHNYLKPNNLGSQLKDSVALNLFTASNALLLLEHENYQAAIYFLPIVFWRLAIQGLNITIRTRIQLLKAAFEIVQKTHRLASKPGNSLCQNATQGRADPILFYRNDDVRKFLCSLPTLACILEDFGDVPNLALNRIGTSDLEHLFGITRLGTRGDNHGERIVHRLVTSAIAVQFAGEHGVIMSKNRVRNTAGALCCSEQKQNVPIPFGFCDGLFRLAKRQVRGPKSDTEEFRIQILIAWLHPKFTLRDCITGKRIQDGQKEVQQTILGARATMSTILTVEAGQSKCVTCERTENVAEDRASTAYYWTKKRLKELKTMAKAEIPFEEILRHFDATSGEVLRGLNRLMRDGRIDEDIVRTYQCA
jgi:hypothetical protein